MTEHMTRHCYQPWESLNVAADGTVYPCCVVHDTLIIGSLSSQSLQDIVQGSAIVTLKSKILNGDISDLPCAGCTNGPLGPKKEFARRIAELYLVTSALESPCHSRHPKSGAPQL